MPSARRRSVRRLLRLRSMRMESTSRCRIPRTRAIPAAWDMTFGLYISSTIACLMYRRRDTRPASERAETTTRSVPLMMKVKAAVRHEGKIAHEDAMLDLLHLAGSC